MMTLISNPSITAILVDDEPAALDSLSMIIAKHCPQVSIIGTASQVHEARDLINKCKPKLVFLDIEMPGLNGFNLLKLEALPRFQVIFTTAYSHYAIQAIKFSAVDYLLKPIEPNELQAAVARALARNDEKAYQQQLQELVMGLMPGERRKLAIPDNRGTTFLPIQDIHFMEADGNYTLIYGEAERLMVSTRVLKDYELLLREAGFFRVHHSFLVSLAHIRRFDKEDGGYIIMLGGKRIPVARRRKNEMLRLLQC